MAILICGGERCLLVCQLHSLEIQLSRFMSLGYENQNVGWRGRRGQNMSFRGVDPLIPFFPCSWVSFFLLPICVRLGLPGLCAIFSLHLDRFSLASTYNGCEILSLKSKVY